MKNGKAGLECCLVIFARILETKLKKGMRRILLLLIIMASASAYGQTYIKLNAPAALLGALNPSVETSLGKNWTFSFEFLATFRNENNSHGPFRVLMIMPEGRYYFKERFKGFYAGVNTGYAMARMTKPNWWGEDYAAEHIYDVAWIILAGFNFGYEYQINDRWMLEAFVGGGRAWSMHERFYYPDGGRPIKDDGKPLKLNGSEEYLPYKGGVNISYRLGK